MEWLSLLLTAVLFAAACNLDTVILSMGYAVKGVRVSLSHSLIIAALTTLITWASLLLGAGAARVLRGPLPNLLGGLVLAGIGAWFVLDWLRRLGPAGEAEGENRAATLWGCVSLAAALAHRPQLLILDEATAGLDPVVRDEILDEFLNFICDEDHAILISSHITSDLEKAADYITYLHQGRVVLSQPKDELLDRYGRVGCSTGDLAAIEPGDLLRVRRGTFGCEGLTSDRDVYQKKYPGLTVDPASLEDIMLLIGKGESLCTD